MKLPSLIRSSLACILLLTGGAVSAQAQTDYSAMKATRSLTIGAGFAGGASLQTDPPTGQKVGVIFAYRATVDASYPLTPTIGVGMSLGLDSRGSKYPVDNSDDYSSTRINYFTITPAMRFSSFLLALNLGVPLGGSSFAKSGSTEQTVDFTTAENDRLQLMIEPRIGFVIPLVDEEIGMLGLTVSGGYCVSEVSLNSDAHLVSGHLGLTWQFAIPGTKKKK
jgi:hypothetical protein